MLRLSDFYMGRYQPHLDTEVVGWRVDEYIVESYGQESHMVSRLFVDTEQRESEIVYDFPCGTVLVVKEVAL